MRAVWITHFFVFYTYLVEGFDGADKGVEITDPPVDILGRLDLLGPTSVRPRITTFQATTTK